MAVLNRNNHYQIDKEKDDSHAEDHFGQVDQKLRYNEIMKRTLDQRAIKTISNPEFCRRVTLPLIEQWEDYVVPNHSRFAPIDDKNFLEGTRVMVALGKVGSQNLQREFRRDARRFLEDFLNCVLSTVAARSVIGQGLSCFCPAIVVGGDDVAPLQIFNKLLDGLLEKGWTKGSEVEACRAEYQSFAQEQRQLERSSTRSRPDVGDVLSFCSGQAGFHARQHLYKVCVVARQVCDFIPCKLSQHFMHLYVLGVPVDDTCDPWVFSIV